MYDEMFKKFTSQFEQAFAPAQQFASLALDHTEKFVGFQLDAAKSYADFGVEQARGALAVSDAKSLQDYVSKQQEVVTTLGRKVSDDVETLAGFGKDFSEAATKLAQQNVANVQSAAAPKAKKSA